MHKIICLAKATGRSLLKVQILFSKSSDKHNFTYEGSHHHLRQSHRPACGTADHSKLKTK